MIDEFYKVLNSHKEWLIAHSSGKTFALNASEIEFEESKDKVLISFIDEDGFQTWRILESEIENEQFTLKLSKNFGKDKDVIELIPREKAELLGAEVELARLERANKIAELLVSEIENIKLKRVELNKENGRFAQIILEKELGLQTAVLSDVSDSLSPEILLSTAIIWLSKLQKRKKNPIDEIWILGEEKQAQKLQKLHACLQSIWKERIKLKLVSRRLTSGKKEEQVLASKLLQIDDLWSYKPATKLHFNKNFSLSGVSQEIIKLAPKEIDYLCTKGGETLRYLGLAFVRIRKFLDEEKSWFGLGNNRRILDESSYEDFYELFENIKKYRRFDSQNKQHRFYFDSNEAWLESILRENIKLLDENLVLSPIYNQFRTSRDKIDLLALRKDGRLVIIELKVALDREMIFQAVDYWRKIELQRRKGVLNKANLFGNLEIADKATIIYLVAPKLSYHRDFSQLAKTVSDEINIHRFDLSEKWREDLKVLERKKV